MPGGPPGGGPAGGPESGPPANAQTRVYGSIRHCVPAAGGWAWIFRKAGEDEIRVGDPAAPVTVAKGKDWEEVAADESQVWILERNGERAALLRAERRAGAIPERVLGDLPRAAGLRLLDGKLYWLEVTPGEAPGFGFLPAAAPLVRLRERDPSGAVREVARWAGSQGYRKQPQRPIPLAPGADDVIGRIGDELYVRYRRPVTTEFMAVSLSSGAVRRVALERNEQQGAIYQGRFHWTGASEEAMPITFMRCVRRVEPGGAPETLSDWLPSTGSLLALSNGLYYLGTDGLMRLPRRLGPGRMLDPGIRPPAVAAGNAIAVLFFAERIEVVRP